MVRWADAPVASVAVGVTPADGVVHRAISVVIVDHGRSETW